MQTTPTTELEAVNIMLSAIGEAPVNTLDDAGTYDLAFAKRILAEVDREVQSFGWRFNSDTDVDLAKDGNGHINLPANLLRVRLKEVSGIEPVIRGSQLYDRKNKTSVFTLNLVAERVVYRLPFDDLPETARHYITARATRRFQDRVQGDHAQHQYTTEDETAARSILRKDQADTTHLSMLQAPGVREVVSRRMWRW